jgi:sulfoxide reductase heme-binding subunit YedZ
MARNAWPRRAALLCAALPLAKMALDAATGGLGANPVEQVLNRLGFWTLTFLTLSLVPTPARELLGVTWPLRTRRVVGVTAFAYGALHLAWYAVVDQGLDGAAIAADAVKRRFITIGLATLLVLLPLAVTSTDGWVRRLGFGRWKALHRLVYLAALGGVVHFVWRVKVDLRRPLVFATAIGLLLLARLVPWAWRRARAPRATLKEAAPP